MDLFNPDANANLLPYDGDVRYYGIILDAIASQHYFEQLLNLIEWQNDKAVIYGKTIITKRKVAWYADKPYEYTYSRTTKRALLWNNDLLELKKRIESKTGETYNSCLLNLYHSGEEGMAWHSDGEKDLKENGCIASLSLGACRKFAFKHKKSNLVVNQVLENGSLLTMKGETQQHWQHRLPPTKKVKSARINLTFRTIDQNH